MKHFLRMMVSLCLAAMVLCQQETEQEQAARIAAENESARYSFFANVDDTISGLMQHREEMRHGLNVKGSYSYSDGFFKRTVNYEADQNGYRVVGEKIEPLSGPSINPEGIATVHTQLQDGSLINYRIQRVPE